MIETISKKFSSKPQPASVGDCPGCGGAAWWLPRNQSEWRCENCNPPPSEIFVAHRRGASRVSAEQREPAPTEERAIVSTTTVTCCQPWCERCGGWRGREIEHSDGLVETRCWTCGAEMPEWPELHMDAAMRAAQVPVS